MKSAEILCRLNAQYGEKTLSYASAYDWYNKFSEDHKEVSNLMYAHIQPITVHYVNICCVEKLYSLDTQKLQCMTLHPTVV
jgi:hypothetical protein